MLLLLFFTSHSLHHPLDSGGSGGWVSEGLEVVSKKSGANLTTVECNSTHLTNFAVLVDVAGGLEVRVKIIIMYL